jgi:glycosyltransferase involved in cell wall biosynthesis
MNNKGKQHITVLVSNDLEYDQRVAKVCSTLQSLNYEITLVGRMLPQSKPFDRPYKTVRFKLWFSRGALFYAVLNLRLFFFLLGQKTDVILANDLDTLLPAFLVSRLRKKKLVYDSHEYFTEAEGLTGRSFQKGVWERIERWIFPRLEKVYTVNESIARIYREKYNVDVKVVRNIPRYQPLEQLKSRAELHMPVDKKIIILQGAFIDPDRGGMEAVEAMQHLSHEMLYVIGAGRDINNMIDRAQELDVDDRIVFLPRMPFDQLRHYTANADLGLSLDKPLHLNYTLSLPNKVFDYIHAGIPVLCSDLPELRRLVSTYHVGMLVSDLNPKHLAKSIDTALHHPDYSSWKANCIQIRQSLSWQGEEVVLKEIYG